MADDAPDPLIGTTVGGKFRIERARGRGGMGAVYEGTHLEIGKRVALKFLDEDAARDADAVTRFQREARAASAVESEHIVQIFDTGRGDDGRPYLVMECLRGEDLRAALRREGRLDPETAVEVALGVLRGLSKAHQAGIVHRDLKPDNVFLVDRDPGTRFVKILDFGISKIAHAASTASTLTGRGTVLGTVFYMSPEQAQSFADIDGRADLYSVGAMLFEALAGRPPHEGPTYESILVSICTKDAPPLRQLAPDVPAPIAEVVDRALRRERSERFASADELLVALADAARRSGLRIPTERLLISSIHPRPSDARREAGRYGVLALVAALAAFAVTAFFMSGGSGGAAPTALPPSPSLETPRSPIATVTAEPTSSPVVSAAPSSSTGATKPRLATSPAPRSSTAPPKPRPATGIASGLQLDTTEP